LPLPISERHCHHAARNRAGESAGKDFKATIKEYQGEAGKMLREIILNLPTSPESSTKIRQNIREALD